MALECERKYLGIDFASLRQALKDMQAQCHGAHLESNTLWDTPEGVLRPQGVLLRLRTQQWFRPERVAHVITLKTASNEIKGCKIREELEVTVSELATMEAIWQALGYGITARYEKVREVWSLDNTELDMDILPFGNIIEVEGAAEDIIAVAKKLRIQDAQTSTASYHRLHQQWRTEQGLEPDVNFVFNDSQKASLIAYLQEMHP